MNTINNLYSQGIRQQHISYPKALAVINKILVVISIYLAFGLLFQTVYANTDSGNRSQIDPYQAQHGSVWLLPDNGQYIEALQMQTDVDYLITGAIARATVRQQFTNNSGFWAEGLYVFPLPEKAAVDQFRMIIGERIIEGQVKPRLQAKKTYERAKAAGKKASLIEQQRPNVFTTSLANIAPGESITIEFEYQQILDYKDQSYRLRFPMVVGPRYHPRHPDKNIVPDSAADNTSVYTETDATKNTNNPTRIHLLLDAGVSLSELKSSYHRVNINQTSESRYSISTIGENIIANRDFELIWKPELSDAPQLTAFKETIDGYDYAMVTLLPPELSHLQQKVQSRDVIFVLDISGSMSGTSIEQAKASLITALDGLSAIDRFNIIWFNDQSGRLYPDAVFATDRYKNTAKRYIGSLKASGGTEMLAALQLALSDQQEFSRFRQVVFLTDGNISNEDKLFDVINQQLGNSRLFTIGIGSAPNSYFMRKAANLGRGTFTTIGDVNEVQKRTAELFKKLETPALINIQVDIDRDRYEVFPNIIPDLYAGETTTVVIRGKDLPKSISIMGDYGNIEWQHSSELLDTAKDGVRVAWAREKISSLMSMRHDATADNERDAIEKEVTLTALEHHLVSRYTSLVAVDVTPVNIDGMLLHQRMRNNLPHGWKKPSSSNGLMLAQTAAGSNINILLAFLMLISGTLLHQLKKYI